VTYPAYQAETQQYVELSSGAEIGSNLADQLQD